MSGARLLVAAGLLATSSLAAAAEPRVALVVDNSAYVHTAPRANPLNDAQDVTAALKQAGFEVVEAVDVECPHARGPGHRQ